MKARSVPNGGKTPTISVAAAPLPISSRRCTPRSGKFPVGRSAKVCTATSTPPTNRPLILCEYSHAMGNSNGGLADYYAAFRALPRLQGGFIWDWVDQGLRAHTADGREFWAYGGDFGDTPTDRDFCINGLIAPDRTVHPGIREFRKLAQEWKFEPKVEGSTDGRSVSVALRSGLNFVAAEGYTLHWRYTIDGGEPERLARGGATRGSIPIPSIPVDETLVLPIVALSAPVGADGRTGEEILTVEITRGRRYRPYRGEPRGRVETVGARNPRRRGPGDRMGRGTSRTRVPRSSASGRHPLRCLSPGVRPCCPATVR